MTPQFRRHPCGTPFRSFCMSTLAVTDDIFFNRAGLDRTRTESIVSDALSGADDGELYLEYSQSESLSWDDGKLKSASFDTSQGFGLRADVGRGDRLCPCLDPVGRRDQARRGDGSRRPCRPSAARMAEPPTGTNRGALRGDQSAGPGRFRDQGEAAVGYRRLCPRPRPARASGDRPRSAASGRRCRSSAPTACASPTSARWSA